MRKCAIILIFSLLVSCITRPYTVQDSHHVISKPSPWELSLVPGLPQCLNGEYAEGRFTRLLDGKTPLPAPAINQERAAPNDGTITCRLAADSSGIDDKSFNAEAWRGILRFYGDTWENTTRRGKYYDVITAPNMDMYASAMQRDSSGGYDLIITTDFTFADTTGEVAGKNPKQKHLIVDANWMGRPNVMKAGFAEHEESYLVGVAAALKAQEDKITNPRFGFIGGVASPTISKFEMGYVQGILSVIPNAK